MNALTTPKNSSLHIVMDGGGDLPKGWAQEYAIQVIPINIHFGEKMYLQGVDLQDDEFYQIADSSGQIPKTSQPTPGQFISFYEKIAAPGERILSVHLTSKLSGTFESAVLAVRELAGKFNITTVDSGAGSAALGMMCKEARLLERSGASFESIVERMRFISQNVRIVLTLENFEYALRSGRVKAFQAAVASLLRVKPIIMLRDGALHMSERIRTRHHSIERIIQVMREDFGDRPVNVAVVHARDLETAKMLLDKVKKTLNCHEVVMTDLSIAVAANLGPGTVGIVAYPVQDA